MMKSPNWPFYYYNNVCYNFKPLKIIDNIEKEKQCSAQKYEIGEAHNINPSL